MSLIDRIALGIRPRPPSPDVSHSPSAPNAELVARRDRLLEKLTVMQSDLGGLTYEMAIRDHYRLDVLTRKAAELQEVEVELGQLERLIKLENAGAAGNCPDCGALHAYGAFFCSLCGQPLTESEVTRVPENGAAGSRRFEHAGH
jgi:hypothetical protein